MTRVLAFIRENPGKTFLAAISGVGIIYVGWKLLSAIVKYCLANPRVFSLGLLVLGSLIVYRAYQLKPLLEDMSGQYKNTMITINLDQNEGQLTGSLTTDRITFPVEGAQTSLGTFSGHYLDGDKKYPLSISHPFSNLFSSANTLSANLEAAGKTFELDRQLVADVDLSGDWSGLQAKLQIQESGENDNNWNALLKTTSGVKRLLTFSQLGTNIRGTYKDNGQHFFDGEYSAESNRLKIKIENTFYQFSRGEIADPGELMQQYAGTFIGEGTNLQITIRSKQDSASEKRIHVCDGTVRSHDINSPILSCGLDPGSFWFNYRDGNDFALGHLNSTASGIELKMANRTAVSIQKAHYPLLAGRYISDGGTIVSLEQLDGDIWSGNFISDNEKHPFKGRFASNKLEGLYIDESGLRNSFVLDSRITAGTLTFKDKKSYPVSLQHKAAYQPHTARDLKVIDAALAEQAL
jgi:hypothetical protein